MTLVACSNFVKRQTPDSEFSYFDGTWDELTALVVACWDLQTPGYRDGVILIPLPGIIPAASARPERYFYTNIVQLQEGDKLVGEYKARREGEEPRKSFGVVGGKKTYAAEVDVVCYRADVLDEDGDRSTDAEWEIISINAYDLPRDMPVPMPPETLIANHFHLSGGTKTNMSAEEFVQALKKSVLWWKGRAHVLPK